MNGILHGFWLGLTEFSACLFSDETLAGNVCCGIVAGVVSSAIANPTDVLKVNKHLYTCT